MFLVLNVSNDVFHISSIGKSYSASYCFSVFFCVYIPNPGLCEFLFGWVVLYFNFRVVQYGAHWCMSQVVSFVVRGRLIYGFISIFSTVC